MAILTRLELLALLPDNTQGDINPLDVREIVNNTLGVYGGLVHSESGVGTQTFSTADQFEKLQQWEFALPNNGITPDISGASSGSLIVQVDGTYIIHYDSAFTIGLSVTKETYTMKLYKNDILLHPQIGSSAGGIAASFNLSFSTTITAVSGDEFSIYAASSLAPKTLNVEYGQFIITRME